MVPFFLVPDIHAVVYTTRSIHSHENEQAVTNAVKWHKEHGEGSRPFRVCPPTLPLLASDIKNNPKAGNKQHTSTESLKKNFLRMRQNPQMNGCFIAVLVREVSFDETHQQKRVIRIWPNWLTEIFSCVKLLSSRLYHTSEHG